MDERGYCYRLHKCFANDDVHYEPTGLDVESACSARAAIIEEFFGRNLGILSGKHLSDCVPVAFQIYKTKCYDLVTKCFNCTK